MSRRRRVPVPAVVRDRCVALRRAHGVEAFRIIRVGELTFEDLMAEGGTVTPKVLERVQAALREIGGAS